MRDIAWTVNRGFAIEQIPLLTRSANGATIDCAGDQRQDGSITAGKNAGRAKGRR
jgi:hypothetical protein